MVIFFRCHRRTGACRVAACFKSGQLSDRTGKFHDGIVSAVPDCRRGNPAAVFQPQAFLVFDDILLLLFICADSAADHHLAGNQSHGGGIPAGDDTCSRPDDRAARNIRLVRLDGRSHSTA